MIRAHRIPHSTNVERVALAAGIKGVEVEWVDHDPADRSLVLTLSGQELVPVAEFGDVVVADSVAILERLEHEFPDPPLYPADPGERALAEILIEWFNDVWKRPPNALADDPGADPAESRTLAERIGHWTNLLNQRLASETFLLGPRICITDVCAYPFLRYAVDAPAAEDDDPFHAVLHEHLRADGHDALTAWIARMAELPQA